MANLIYGEESYKIIGACFEVYKQKGCGFTEPVYQDCLKIEFRLQGIPFVFEPKINLEYKGEILDSYFKPDFVCFDKIIVELKAVATLIDEHRAQTINYVNATNYDLGLLVNFGHFPKIEHERFGNKKVYRSLKDEIRSWNK
ncbi:MAG TPA: GxxExxY protein [Pyrinomonadaceae bacterium]|nr:GxxExxY protein [Pyrinomonadaceae bacterium]